MPTPDDPLDRLHRDLGWKRLNPAWAKAEIFLGLLAFACGVAGVGLLAGVAGLPPWVWLGPVLLIDVRRLPRARRTPQPLVSIE